MAAGDPEAFNAHEAHRDGSHSVRTGLVPIWLAGYQLPHRGDPDRLANRDVYSMTPDECDSELAALEAACSERERLRRDENVRDVVILRERGSISFEEWADSRRIEIAKRLIYGR